MQAEYENFLNKVRKAKVVKLYGAGKFARILYLFLSRQGIEVEAFVVTDIEQNPTELFQKPVIGIESLAFQNTSNLVVGFENEEVTNDVINFLSTRWMGNIIKVSYDIIIDIYCNYVVDEHSVDSFCRGLSKEKKVIAYVADADGEMVVQYLLTKQVQVRAICKEWRGLFLNKMIPVLSFEQLINEDKDNALVLTMGCSDRQVVYMKRLRRAGFEKIIFISEEIKKTIKDNYREFVWEENGAQFQVLNLLNVEQNHYIVQREQASKIYRWRTPSRYQFSYNGEQLEAIRNDELFKEYKNQFPDCCYLPYEEVSLQEVQNVKEKIEVYITKFYKDKRIEPVSLPTWGIPIQAGKALTDVQVAEICDNTGDNISSRNEDYSEGTALYWIWKNTYGQDYVGVFHYRRHMAMGKDGLQNLLQYDVLLTVPNYVPMKIKEFFCTNYILDYDWELMMHYIRKYDDAYYNTALIYENAHSYFPCNIFIMRREQFDKMCMFVFNILDGVDSYYQRNCQVRKDRYLGYLLENLVSIYVMHNSGKMKIAYTDMKYYSPIEESS